ncbi:hypothetical protein [Cryptosporangium sp. NPDC048952]|uniref:hypothetical protein n=1 Tax=Cryptosporangium sp. NPDC048952 TaxID=3363961 RepID=UPI003716335E
MKVQVSGFRIGIAAAGDDPSDDSPRYAVGLNGWAITAVHATPVSLWVPVDGRTPLRLALATTLSNGGRGPAALVRQLTSPSTKLRKRRAPADSDPNRAATGLTMDVTGEVAVLDTTATRIYRLADGYLGLTNPREESPIADRIDDRPTNMALSVLPNDRLILVAGHRLAGESSLAAEDAGLTDPIFAAYALLRTALTKRTEYAVVVVIDAEGTVERETSVGSGVARRSVEREPAALAGTSLSVTRGAEPAE